MSWPRIKEARTAKGWTQEELASRLGVTQPQIGRWETGDGDIKGAKLIELSEVLGVTVSYILGVSEGSEGVEFADFREAELLDLFRSMDQQGRDALVTVARALAR